MNTRSNLELDEIYNMSNWILRDANEVLDDAVKADDINDDYFFGQPLASNLTWPFVYKRNLKLKGKEENEKKII